MSPPDPADPPVRRTVGGGATVTSVAAIATAVAGGLLGVIVARTLGASETGAYNVASTTLLVGMTFMALGVNVGAIYLVSNGRWAPADAFRQVQVAAAITGLAGVCVGLIALVLGRDTLFDGVPIEVVLIALAAIPFALSWTHSAAISLALDRYEDSALAPVYANVTALALTAVLTPTIGLTGAVTALAAAHAINAIRLLIVGRKTIPAVDPGWLSRGTQDLRAAVSFGFKSYLPQALQLLNYRADLFILNAFAAASTVGHYAVALLVTEVGFLLPRSLAAVVMPRVAALDTDATPEHQEMVIVKSVRHVLLLMPPIAIVLAVGVLTIPLVFGSDFDESIVPGLILVPGVLAIGVANVLSATIVGKGRPEYALYGALLATPVTLGLYFALIPTWEGIGAAVASTASYLLSAAISLYFFRRAWSAGTVRALLPGREDLGDYRELWNRGREYLRDRRR